MQNNANQKRGKRSHEERQREKNRAEEISTKL